MPRGGKKKEERRRWPRRGKGNFVSTTFPAALKKKKKGKRNGNEPAEERRLCKKKKKERTSVFPAGRKGRDMRKCPVWWEGKGEKKEEPLLSRGWEKKRKRGEELPISYYPSRKGEKR